MSYSELCSSHPAISAVQDFSKGVACGKRDSRWGLGSVNRIRLYEILLKGLSQESRNLTH